MIEKLDIMPFREATARSGLTICELARLMSVDESRVRQLLGRTKNDRYSQITYETGVKWCRALGLDPVDLNV